MNKKFSDSLLLIVRICLIIIGVVFICLSIFTEKEDNTYLIISLFSTSLVNVLNIIDTKKKK